jgi:hypothetical protein
MNSISAARRRLLSSTALLLCVGLPVFGAVAQTLPTAGKVASGSVVIGAAHSHSLAIRQSSPRAIVNWGSFSIGAPDSVTIRQPNASSAISTG